MRYYPPYVRAYPAIKWANADSCHRCDCAAPTIPSARHSSDAMRNSRYMRETQCHNMRETQCQVPPH